MALASVIRYVSVGLSIFYTKIEKFLYLDHCLHFGIQRNYIHSGSQLESSQTIYIPSYYLFGFKILIYLDHLV
jgi:hypothetical protein